MEQKTQWQTYLGVLAILLFALESHAQGGLSIKEIERDGLIRIVAVNRSRTEYTMRVNAQLKNVTPSRKLPFDTTIPPDTAIEILAFRITGLTDWSYRYSTRKCIGNAHTCFHDSAATYSLPYSGKRFKHVNQPYNGRFSHENERALDFDLSVGDTVLAAREGKVVEFEESHDSGCRKPKCASKNNYLIIEHKDGSLARYDHLMKNGVIPKLGDMVRQKQPIAISGNTGYSSGPHLHFEVFLPEVDGTTRTLETNFRHETAKGVQIIPGSYFNGYTATLPGSNQIITRQVLTELLSESEGIQGKCKADYPSYRKSSGRFKFILMDSLVCAIPVDTLHYNTRFTHGNLFYESDGKFVKWHSISKKWNQVRWEQKADTLSPDEYYATVRTNDTLFIFEQPSSYQYKGFWRKNGRLKRKYHRVKFFYHGNFDRYRKSGKLKSRRTYKNGYLGN